MSHDGVRRFCITGIIDTGFSEVRVPQGTRLLFGEVWKSRWPLDSSQDDIWSEELKGVWWSSILLKRQSDVTVANKDEDLNKSLGISISSWYSTLAKHDNILNNHYYRSILSCDSFFSTDYVCIEDLSKSYFPKRFLFFKIPLFLCRFENNTARRAVENRKARVFSFHLRNQKKSQGVRSGLQGGYFVGTCLIP